MGEIRVREVDDQIIAELRLRATRNGRSLSEELREILANEAQRPRRECLKQIEALHARIRERVGGRLPDTTPLIREERDRRG